MRYAAPWLEDNDHRAFGNLFVELSDVGEMEDGAAPREMARAFVRPFARLAVEADAAAETCRFQRRRALFPSGGDLRGLRGRDETGGESACGVELVRVVDLHPVAAVESPVCAGELAAPLPHDEAHTLRRLVVAFKLLLAFSLTETHVVLARHATIRVETHTVTLLIDERERGDRERHFHLRWNFKRQLRRASVMILKRQSRPFDAG